LLEPVTLDQLRVLIAIADAGSFSAAARKLKRAQSAISHAVASLEASLAFSLFDRASHKPQLTDAGRIMLADARAVVSRAGELRERAKSIAEDVEPDLSLAVDVMFPVEVLTESLRALQVAFPLLAVTVHTDALGAVEARLRDGTARLGIGPDFQVDATGPIERRPLTEIAMASMVARDHPLAAWQGTIPRHELERHVQLVLTDRSQLTSGIMRGVVSPRVWRFADLATRYGFLKAGLGFCNMPLHMVKDDLATGRLKRIVVEGWERPDYAIPLYLMFPRGHVPGRAACWLIKDMEARFKQSATIAPVPPAPQAAKIRAKRTAGRGGA
jgi:DNA-binding transcriptional LysR family regulator